MIERILRALRQLLKAEAPRPDEPPSPRSRLEEELKPLGALPENEEG